MAKFDQDMINKLEELERVVGMHDNHTPFKTRVYIPVAYIDEEIAKHEKFVRERGLKIRAILTRDEMKERILGRINSFWSFTYGVKEYSLYVNSVTGERRKLV
jgi:hypothetical protein